MNLKCLATVSVRGTLLEKLEAIAVGRFGGVELLESDLMDSRLKARSVYRMAQDLGLSIAIYQPLRDVEGVADGVYVRSLDRLERSLDLAAELGARTVIVCSNASSAAINDGERSAAQLAGIADRASQRGLRIGFEALSWGTHINTYSGAWRIVRKSAHPNLGLVLDSFHICALSDDPARIEAIPGDQIFALHLADAPLAQCDLLFWSRNFRCLPGEGEFRVAEVFRRVLNAHYTGPVSLEIYGFRAQRTDARRLAAEAQRSLLALEEQYRRTTNALGPGSIFSLPQILSG